MGRGRAKAKQQKVARDLKYNTHFTDLDALQRELGVPGNPGNGAHEATGEAESLEDDYDNWTSTER